MKTIIKVLIILCIGTQSYSQEIVPIENQISHIDYSREDKPYYKDVNGVFNKFLGTWRYQTTTELFEITITKVTKEDSGNYYKDRLTSRYKYVKDGVVIYDTTPMIQPAGSAPNHNVFGGRFDKENLNKVELQYNEPDIDLWGNRLILTYLPITGQLKWYVRTAMEPNGTGKLAYPYRIPYVMTLTKVN